MRAVVAGVAAALMLAPAVVATAHAEPSTPTVAVELLHTLTSPNETDIGLFGRSVAAVPDVDGDGVDDLLVGADNEAAAGSPEGAGLAYVYSGATGELVRTFASPNEEVGGGFGFSVAGVPDLDGDGRGDLLVGAPFEDDGANSTGRAYVLSGATGDLLHTIVSPAAEGAGFFGLSVAGLGATDRDAHLAVGAPSEDGGEVNAGRVHVFSGTTGALLRTVVSPTPEQFGDFGDSISGVPDVDGDGRDDLLVGASEETRRNAGRAHLFSGSDGSLLHTLAPPIERFDGFFGIAVSGVPDVDGDGRGDLIVGEVPIDFDSGLPNTGTAYVFSGATGDLLHELVSPDPEDFGVFAEVLSGVPDVDGDGRGELLIGAPGEGCGGRAYLFSGASGALLHELTSPNGRCGFGGNFGSALAGVEDIDGDGRGELLVGAQAEDRGALDAVGRAYLFSAGPSQTELQIAAAALNSPVPRGGSLELSVTVENNTADDVTGDLRLRVLTPTGGTVTLRLLNDATVNAGQRGAAVLEIPVSADAPLGGYQGTVEAVSDGAILGAGTFDFDVVAGVASAPLPNGSAAGPIFGLAVVLSAQGLAAAPVALGVGR